MLGARRPRRSAALLAVVGRRRRRTHVRSCSASRSCILSLVPDRCARSASPSGSRTRPARARDRRLVRCCRSSALDSRRPEMDFSIFLVGGLMIVVGATWVIVYNADLLLGAARRGRSGASARPRAGAAACRWRIRCGACSAPASRWRCSRSSSSRSSSARPRPARSCNASNDIERVRRRLRRPRARGRRRARSTTCRRRVRHAPGVAAGGLRGRRRAQSDPAASRRRQARHRREGRSPTRCTALDAAFLRAHDLRLRRGRREGYGSARDVWQRCATRPNLAVVDPLVVPAPRQLELRRRCPTSS